jgi:hypothetical protein
VWRLLQASADGWRGPFGLVLAVVLAHVQEVEFTDVAHLEFDL